MVVHRGAVLVPRLLLSTKGTLNEIDDVAGLAGNSKSQIVLLPSRVANNIRALEHWSRIGRYLYPRLLFSGCVGG